MNSRGFSLLEILVTLLIFALGGLALANLQILSVRGSGFNRETTVATTLAQMQLEQLKATPYNGITTDSTGVQEQNAGVLYKITWVVSESGTFPSRYKYVTVIVTWASKSITADTIVSEI